MKTPMDRSEYRRAVRDFLNRSRAALAACYAASPLDKPETPARRQEIAPNDIPSIRSQLDGAVKRLGDALLWHGIYCRIALHAGATEAEEEANMLDSRVRNLRIRLQVAQDEVATRLARQVETRLDNAREAIVSAIDSHRPDSPLTIVFKGAKKIAGELCAALRPVFRDIDDQLVQDLVELHGSCYPVVARDVKEMADFLAQGVEERLGRECGSALRGLWKGVQDNTPFALGPERRAFFSACLDATNDNNAWISMLIADFGIDTSKKNASKRLWKKVQPQVKERVVKLLQEAWNAGSVASLQQNLEQTEHWVERCKAAIGATPVGHGQQVELESSLKEVEAAHAQGAELLALLDKQPELGGDEAALHAFLRNCEASFAAMGEAMVAFSAAVKKSVVDRLPVGGSASQATGDILLPPTHLSGYVCTMPNLIEIVGTLLKKAYENVTEDEAREAVVLDWRGLGTAIFGLPEYTSYRKAVADAVESLLQRFGSLEFCSPAVIGTEDARAVDANSRKAWGEYWSAVAPDGVFNAPLNEVLQNVTTACDRALDDVWALERQRLEREFTWNPVSQYNYYYDPQEKS